MNVITGDLTNLEDVKKIPSGINSVIHLAAIIPPLADTYPELARRVNVEGTRLLVNHLQSSSPEAFIIFSSSVSVYGDRVKTPDIYVTDPVNISEGDHYGQTKLDAETVIRNSSLKWTMFRLAAIMKSHKISGLMFHMPLETTLEFATARDVAYALCKAAEVPDQLKFRTFNLGGGDSCCMSYREFLTRSFRIYGLGSLDFPQFAFATRNYHCGRMADGDELEAILHFRRDTAESYFQQVRHSVSGIQRFLTICLRPLIKFMLLRKSAPFRAFKSNNRNQLRHFFYDADLEKQE